LYGFDNFFIKYGGIVLQNNIKALSH